MMKIICNLVLIFILVSISGCMTTMRTLKTDQDTIGAEPDQGYLFMVFSNESYISSIELRGDNSIKLENFIEWNEGRYIFLAPIPKGEYQISKINLDYRRYFEFDDDEIVYGFKIEPDVINYVGELKETRSADKRSYFELINRSSIGLEFMEEKFPIILASRALKYSGPGNDNFFELIFDKKGVDK